MPISITAMASASDLQEQGLAFYSKHEQYLLSPQKSLSLIVHEPFNFPSWLVAGIIQQSLSNDNECYLSPQSLNRRKSALPTFLYSFSDTEVTYSKYFHKYVTKNRNMFTFKSFLSEDSISLDSWNKFIHEQLKKSALSFGSPPVVILENPELLLSIVPEMTVCKLLSQIMAIQQESVLYIVTCSSILGAPQFLPALLHRSSLLVSLTPLTTGRADDISGILSISPGPVHSNDKLKDSFSIADRQYSYLVTTNAVKLYFK